MSGRFITKDDIARDTFDWGQSGWMSRPSLTGSTAICVMDVAINPGGGHNFHRHPDQEELIWVLEGRIEQWLEKDKQVLEAGEAVYIPKDLVHASFNVGDSDAKIAVILSPTAGDDGYSVVDVFEEEPWASPALTAAPRPSPSVLVCGDDPLGVSGLARVAEQGVGAVARTATTPAAAVAQLRLQAPDLLVCEDRLGGRPVDEVVAVLRRAGALAPLVVVATRDTVEVLRAALRAGASGYVLRRDAITALPAALLAVRGGGTVLPAAPPAGEPLTARERELLNALDEGLRFKEVAVRLGIAEATAKTHGRGLFRKLGASSRAEAVRAARDRGLLA